MVHVAVLDNLDIPLEDDLHLGERDTQFFGYTTEIERIESVLVRLAGRSASTKKPQPKDAVDHEPTNIIAVMGAFGSGKSALLRHLSAGWKDQSKEREKSDTSGISCVINLDRSTLDSRQQFWTHLVERHLNHGRSEAERIYYLIRRHWKRIAEAVVKTTAKLSLFAVADDRSIEDQIIHHLLGEIRNKYRKDGIVVVTVDREYMPTATAGKECEIFNSLVRYVYKNRSIETSKGGNIALLVAGRGDTQSAVEACGVNAMHMCNIYLSGLTRKDAEDLIHSGFSSAWSRQHADLPKSGSKFREHIEKILKRRYCYLRNEHMEVLPEFLVHMKKDYPNLFQPGAKHESDMKILEEQLPTVLGSCFEMIDSTIDDTIHGIIDQHLTHIVRDVEQRLLDSANEEHYAFHVAADARLPMQLKMRIRAMEIVGLGCSKYWVAEVIRGLFEKQIEQIVSNALVNGIDCMTERLCIAGVETAKTLRTSEDRICTPDALEQLPLAWQLIVKDHVRAYGNRWCANILREVERSNCADVMLAIARTIDQSGQFMMAELSLRDTFSTNEAARGGYVDSSQRYFDTPGNANLDSVVINSLATLLDTRIETLLVPKGPVKLAEPETFGKKLIPFLMLPFDTAVDAGEQCNSALVDAVVPSLESTVEECIESCLKYTTQGVVIGTVDDNLSVEISYYYYSIVEDVIERSMGRALWDMVFREISYDEAIGRNALEDVVVQHIVAQTHWGVVKKEPKTLRDGLAEHLRHSKSEASTPGKGTKSVDAEARRIARILNIVHDQKCTEEWAGQQPEVVAVAIMNRRLRDVATQHLTLALRWALSEQMKFTKKKIQSDVKSGQVSDLKEHVRNRLVNDVRNLLSDKFTNWFKELLNRDEDCRAMLKSGIHVALTRRFESEEWKELVLQAKCNALQVIGHQTESELQDKEDKVGVEQLQLLMDDRLKLIEFIKQSMRTAVEENFNSRHMYPISKRSILVHSMMRLSDAVRSGLISAEHFGRNAYLGAISSELLREVVRQKLPDSTTVAQALTRLDAIGVLHKLEAIPEEITQFYDRSSSTDTKVPSGPFYMLSMPQLLEWAKERYKNVPGSADNAELAMKVREDVLQREIRAVLDRLS